MTDAKITRIHATSVIVPAQPDSVDRPEFGPSIFDKTPKWIIEAFTDDGLVGCGETPRGTAASEVRWCARSVVGRKLADIPWARPVPIDHASNDMFGHENPPVSHRLHERDHGIGGGSMGVTVAVQDLIARARGIRLCDLYGGPHRERIPTDWWMGRSDPEHAARRMEVGMKHGFTTIKIKAALEDDVIGIVRAIKKVGGAGTRIVIDPNCRFYRVAEAIPVARELEAFENIVLEDPFPFSIEEWQLFRQKTTIPLTMHCATDPHVALAHHCCDYVNLCWPAEKFLGDAHMAWRFGAPCWCGSGVDLGILNAYMLHFSSAAVNCVLPGDAMGHFIREDDLIREKLTATDGAIALPTEPGLGVTVDQEALQKYGGESFEISP